MREDDPRFNERLRCVTIVEKWTRRDFRSLHAGEMTAQEHRTVVAILKAILTEIVGGADD
jgi:hypothetical protein